MRVLMLDTGNPCLPSGGGQSAFLRAIIPHLACDLALCGEAMDEEPLGRWTMRKVGPRSVPYLPIVHSRHGQKTLVPQRMAALSGVARWRRRLELGSDVLYAHSPELLLPFRSTTPAVPVLHVHGNAHPLVQSRYRPARSPIAQAAYRQVVRPSFVDARLLLIVDPGGEQLCNRFAGRDVSHKIRRVPTCFDESVFRPCQSPGEDSTENLTIAFAARIEEGKGLDLLLEAVALLNRQGLEPHLLVAGDGTQRGSMIRLAGRLGVAHRVEHLGWLKGRELAAMLRRASVFALPSANEGMSIAVLEALACGTPVVASDRGAMREIVHQDVNGLVLEHLDPEVLAAGIADVARRRFDRDDVSGTVQAFRGSTVADQVLRLLETASEATRL